MLLLLLTATSAYSGLRFNNL